MRQKAWTEGLEAGEEGTPLPNIEERVCDDPKSGIV
jgi:hypothetical protein